jgi:uncharacterized repeat protein (TIGR01451 family)
MLKALVCGALVTTVLFWIPPANTQISDPLPQKPKQPRPQFVPGEILVRFRSDSLANAVTKPYEQLRVQGREIQMSVEDTDAARVLSGLRVVHVPTSDTLPAIEALSARPDVLYAEPNYVRERFVAPNDPLYPNLWGLHNTGSVFGNTGYFLPGFDIRAEQAWNITTGSRSVVVGIVDGGIDASHPDLQPNIWTNPGEIAGNGLDDDGNGFIDDVSGFDFFHNQGSFFDSGDLDSENHATHVAGIVGAVGDNGTGVVGVNWQVGLMSLKIFGRKDESPFPGSVSVLVRAYAYAKKMRDLWKSTGGTKGSNIRVLNNSIGGYGRSQTEFDAVRALNDSGILFVAAAGNYTRNNDVFPIYPAGYELPNVISVAATSISADYLTNFTNVGARTVTMSAPGQTIQSTTAFGNYATYDGTSMASPYVAGAAALICSAYPNITVDKLRSALIYNGDRVASQEYKTLTGRRLNVFNSLTAVAENDTTAPRGIDDFRIIAKNGRSVTLGWTAPGDDGAVGTAALYDIRYSANDLSSPQLFEAATSISPLAIPIPAAGGSLQSASVDVPFQHTGGFIGLRATDNIGNNSPIAVAPVSIDGNVPGQYDVTESGPQPLTTGGSQVQYFGPAFPDDGYSMEYPLPFAFPFFGSWVRNINISANGAIYFSTPPKFLLPPMTGQSAPLDASSSIRALQTNAMIAGMWDDLYITGGVYAVTPDANRIIFRWEGITFDTQFDDGTSRGKNPIKFEIELRRDGTIQFRYGDGNQKLFPVVGISGGSPDAYVIDSHTSETVFKDLTNANTVTFSPRVAPASTSADVQIVLNSPAVVTPRQAGGNIYASFPQAAIPGQTLQFGFVVTDLGPDAADNVVVVSQLPSGLSFVECGLNVTCTGPPAGSSGGSVTINLGTLGDLYRKGANGGSFDVRVNAAAGTILTTSFSVMSSTADPNPANNTVTQITPVADYSLFDDLVAVAGNNGNTIALKQDGTVWTWGQPFGAVDCEGCGDSLPKPVAGLLNVIAIASGGQHALALKSDGTVWSWGLNDYGQLGNQPIYLNPFYSFPPTQIPGLTNIQSIATGSPGSFALASDGTIWAWGDNTYGQLGDGTQTLRSSPVHLSTVTGVRSLSTNGTCTFAIKQDGSIWSWGSNTSGMLGTGSSASFSPVPVNVTALSNVRMIAIGDDHIVALKNDGTVWILGNGGSGQMGNGTRDSSAVPLQVPGLINVSQVAANSGGCMALKADGSVWTWGEDQLSPIQVGGLPAVRQVAAWWTVHAVVLNDNTLQMWGGFNIHGALGDGTLIPRNVPGPVKSLRVVTAPTINPGGKLYVFPINVTVDCDIYGATIHYTTNGADPTENDAVVTPGSTLRIDRTMVLKVSAWKSGWTPSLTVSATYTVLASPPPLVFLEAGTVNQALALDSVTFVRGPFHVLTDYNFSADHHTRLILFTTNVGLTQPDASILRVQAAGFDLPVEGVGPLVVTGLDCSYIVVRLPDGLPSGDLHLTITVRGATSGNAPTIAISP